MEVELILRYSNKEIRARPGERVQVTFLLGKFLLPPSVWVIADGWFVKRIYERPNFTFESAKSEVAELENWIAVGLAKIDQLQRYMKIIEQLNKE